MVTSEKQMSHLKISQSKKIPNAMFFHPKWLDEKFTNAAGSVILELRPTEKSNLKSLLVQSLNLERCVTKFGDLVQLLLKVGITEFKLLPVNELDSWHQLLINIVCIIGEHQGWNPHMIQPASEIKPPQ